MHPVAVVHHEPECVRVQLAQVEHYGHEHFPYALVVQRAGEMMVIDHIMSLLGTKDDGNHVVSEEVPTFLAHLPPAFAFGLHLAHPDSNLCRAQVIYSDRFQYWFAHVHHRSAPLAAESAFELLGSTVGGSSSPIASMLDHLERLFNCPSRTLRHSPPSRD